MKQADKQDISMRRKANPAESSFCMIPQKLRSYEPETARLLQRLPENLRGAVNDVFLRAARQTSDLTSIVEAVCQWLETKQSANPDYADALRIVMKYRYEARELAGHATRYLILPEEERREHKRRQSEAAVTSWMRGNPATEKQKAMLSRLGYCGRVGDMLEARNLISDLVGSRERGGIKR